jgi:hypothetical protein
MLTTTITETDYFLPEDAEAAQNACLGFFAMPAEVYLSCFTLTWEPLLAALEAADKAGQAVHVLADLSQSLAATEAPRIKALAQGLQHGEVTLTTAGVNSPLPSVIWHWKGICMPSLGLCWEGSTNFTLQAWDEGNSCRSFTSPIWANAFVTQFQAHRTWALANTPQFQKGPVTA